MKNNLLHIIQTVFTGRRQGCPSEDWLKFRIEIFKNYTLKSLLNQSNRNFLHWISWRSEERDNLLVRDLSKYLKNLKYNFVFTFYGQPIWEPHSNNKNIEEKVAKSLKIIEKFHKGEKYVYFTVLDSDDLFYKDAIKEIQTFEYAENGALWFSRGYVLNTEDGTLSFWNPSTCPPFYTILFEAEKFFNPKSYISDMISKLKVHHDIPKVYNAIKLEGRKYLVTINGKNIASRWGQGTRKGNVNVKEKESILKDFGL